MSAAEALKVAEDAVEQLQHAQRLVVQTVETTVALAEFTIEKSNDSIIQVTAGNKIQALMILADLRIRFDKFLEESRKFKMTKHEEDER